MGIELEALPVISRLSATVIRILGCNPGPLTLQGTNTYLVGTGQRRVLIDAGGEDTAIRYTEALRTVLNEERATIEHLIITHWHHDHLGGVSKVQQLLKGTSESATVWKLPRCKKDDNITDLEKNVKCELLNDEQVFDVEGARLRVKHTPGHSSDHACLLLENNNTLFSGDCILGQGTAVFEDLYDYMQSLQKILELEPRTIYPGHGPVICSPVNKIQAYIDHRNEREQQILDALRNAGDQKSMTEREIVNIVYKGIGEELKDYCAINTLHHLEKLLKDGKVTGQPGNWTYVAGSA